eukprot:TRINITY_DN1721_c0_g1_i2.p2 TRINITY_DN1721_c0_g1~~TRINITY_DN1721_c0_g1_i2.p2  ORF type:complete len:171 (+),score=7.51 TRINITY_DN1721_c0_g1_i2:603-1115(+)
MAPSPRSAATPSSSSRFPQSPPLTPGSKTRDLIIRKAVGPSSRPAAPARSASPLAHYSGSNASRSEPHSPSGSVPSPHSPIPTLLPAAEDPKETPEPADCVQLVLQPTGSRSQRGHGTTTPGSLRIRRSVRKAHAKSSVASGTVLSNIERDMLGFDIPRTDTEFVSDADD